MVKSVSAVLHQNLTPRILGIDDTPFPRRQPGTSLNAVGVITSGDRFEGMLYISDITQDGLDATERLAESILQSKFHAQVHAVFLDGITMGGLNVIDIEALASAIERPVIAVMRQRPNLEKMLIAMSRVSDEEERRRRLERAGQIHEVRSWVFQYRGMGVQSAEEVATLLDKCTPQGQGQKVPECLRLAHLIGAAIKTGQSSSSA